MIAFVASLLVASGANPYQSPEQSAEDLAAVGGRSPEEFVAALNALRRDIGHPLLLEGEAGPPEHQAELASHRVMGICALRRQLTGEWRGDRERLKRILDRPEFAGARLRNPEWLTRFSQWVKDWLESLLQANGAQGFAQGTRAAVLSLSVILAVAGMMRLWRKHPPARRISSAEAAPLQLEPPPIHLAMAEAALSSHPRESIRLGLLCLLSWLERNRLARPDRAKTNRELSDELPARGANPEMAATIRGLLQWYDAAFYSLSPVEEPQARAFLAQVATLQSKAEGAA